MATELITWGEKYCLGLDEIDEQHQALVDIINRIWQSIILRSDKQAIFSLIAELEKYTLAHFAAEETLMRITDYPRFEKHKHEGLVSWNPCLATEWLIYRNTEFLS